MVLGGKSFSSVSHRATKSLPPRRLLNPLYRRNATILARKFTFSDTPDKSSSWYQLDASDNHVAFCRLANTTTLDIHITQEGNLNCPMCIDDESSKGSVDFSAVGSFFEHAKLFTRWQVRGIAIGGGEPLFKKRLEVLELVKYANENGYYTTINTNGFLLTEELIQKYHPYLNIIHLSLDGSTGDIVNTIRTAPTVLRKTIENIRAFNDNKYEDLIKVATVATKKNRHDIPNIPAIFEKRKVHSDIWRIYQFRAHRQGRFAVDDLAITEEEVNDTLDQLNATKSHYISKIAPNYTGEYIRKLFLLPDNTMSIGNTKLDFNVTSFDEARFFDMHGNHLGALEQYTGSRIDHYSGLRSRRFRLSGIRREESGWATYNEKRIAKWGGPADYFNSKVSTHKPFLDRVAALADKPPKPALEAGSGSDIRATQLPRSRYSVAFNHGVMEHFCDAEIHETLREMTRVADVFVMCVPTAATGARPQDYYGDERYLEVAHWDEILKAAGCRVVDRFAYDQEGVRSVEGAPFLTYVLAAKSTKLD